MPEAPAQIVALLKPMLRAEYDAILNEPLPERWAELLERLIEKE